MCFFSESTSVTEQNNLQLSPIYLMMKLLILPIEVQFDYCRLEEDLNMTFISSVPAQLEGLLI